MPLSIQVVVREDAPREVKLWLPDGTPLGEPPRRLGFRPPLTEKPEAAAPIELARIADRVGSSREGTGS